MKERRWFCWADEHLLLDTCYLREYQARVGHPKSQLDCRETS